MRKDRRKETITSELMVYRENKTKQKILTAFGEEKRVARRKTLNRAYAGTVICDIVGL